MKRFPLSCIVVLCFLATEIQSKLPSYVDVCYRNDPDVAKCLKKTIQKLVPKLKPGSKDLDLDPLDPLVFKKLVFSVKSPILGGTWEVPEVVITGLSKVKILNVRPKLDNPKKFILDFDVFVPLLNTKPVCKLTGNVFNVEVKMKGHVDLNYEGVQMTYHMKGDVKDIDGDEYLVLDSFRWRFTGDGVKSLRLLNDDVIEGNSVLNKLVIIVIKNLWRPLMNQMLPPLLESTDTPWLAMFNRLFRKYPYDVIFPK